MASRGAGAAIAAGTASSMGSAGSEDSGAHIVRPELKMDHTSLVNVLTYFSCGKPSETRNESGEAKRRPVGSNSRDKDHTVHLVALPVFMT
jgi:hypothetical protein